MVILHQFPRSYTCPNPSPFPIKLETFLRMKEIEYVNDFEQPTGPKGLCPWITLNGEDVADSQFCIEFLKSRFDLRDDDDDVDLEPGSQAWALGRAVRVMLEERLRWCLGLDKWVFPAEDREGKGREHAHDWFPLPGVKIRFLRSLIFRSIARKVRKCCSAVGLFSHARPQIEALGLGDLLAVSALLGHDEAEKPFLLGRTPTEVDCSLFGQVCSILHTTPEGSVYRKALLEDKEGMGNLVRHYRRMRERFWPDWDEQVAKKPF